jgi:steroid 5-alpha reductase family enzyme
MALLTLAWGARLTMNFARKGGYRPYEQDYRWPVLQRHPLLRHPVAWQAFNVGFIAAYQNALLWLIASPSAVAYAARGTPLCAWDFLAAAMVAAALLLEAAADEQQWAFQQSKHRAKGHRRRSEWAEDYARGFRTSGLFRFSRHPNFFAEQCVWVFFHGFALAAERASGTAPGGWGLRSVGGFVGSDHGGVGAYASSAASVGRSGLGAALLVMLFQGSTAFTESITGGKYPEYAAYRRVTSRLVPWWPRGEVPRPARGGKRT